MVLRPRHATAFRTFGDGAIVTGYRPLCPPSNVGQSMLFVRGGAQPPELLHARHRGAGCHPDRQRRRPERGLVLRSDRYGHSAPGNSSRSRSCPFGWWPSCAPGNAARSRGCATWRVSDQLLVMLADARWYRRPGDPGRPGLRGVGARDLGWPREGEAFALGVATGGVAAADGAEVHVAHVVAGELRSLGALRAEIPHRVLGVAAQPVPAGTGDGRVPGAAARVPGGADLVAIGHGPPGVHVHVTLHSVVGDLDGVLALHPVTDLAGAPREPQRTLGPVGALPALVVAAVHRGGRDRDGAVGLHGVERDPGAGAVPVARRILAGDPLAHVEDQEAAYDDRGDHQQVTHASLRVRRRSHSRPTRAPPGRGARTCARRTPRPRAGSR